MRVADVLRGLWLTTRDIAPVALLLLFFQIVVLKAPLRNARTLIAGLVLSVIGLYVFSLGLKLGLMPLGNSVGASLLALRNRALIIGFALLLGYSTALAEPSVAAMAMQIEEVSVGAMPGRILVHTIAAGAALGLGLGAFKILYRLPSTWIIVPLVAIAGILGYFAPERITGIAFDAAAVVTGPVTVPLSMALAVGLASVVGGGDPLIDGFGVVALVALGPVSTVLTLGMLARF